MKLHQLFSTHMVQFAVLIDTLPIDAIRSHSPIYRPNHA